MEFRFTDRDLERLYTEKAFTTNMADALVKAFRKRMQQIRAAASTQDFRHNKGMRFEQLKGSRAHQHSMRLNDQYRLILELRQENGQTVVDVVAVEDYH